MNLSEFINLASAANGKKVEFSEKGKLVDALSERILDVVMGQTYSVANDAILIAADKLKDSHDSMVYIKVPKNDTRKNLGV